MKIGVLALQGAVAEHIRVLTDLNIEAVPIRLPSDLDNLEALVLPGGESTTISKLLSDYGLMEPIRGLAHRGLPMLGTCAGMVLLARKVSDSNLEPFGVVDIEIKRNAFGRQIDSFETELSIPVLGDKTFHGIFIRAPIVENVAPSVEVLCQLGNNAVAVRQGKIVACAFHPELTQDLRLHKYFRDLITGGVIAKGDN